MIRSANRNSVLAKNTSSLVLIKKGVLLYFLLLIFEGALRKWIIPGLSTPLLVVRDPLALWLIYQAWRLKYFKINYLVVLMGIAAVLSFFAALLGGHGNVVVAAYGVRTLIIYFPLIFVLGAVLNRTDVLKIGNMAMWISLPMIILNLLQFYTPQTSIFNIGVGGIGSSGFGGAMDFFRPSGTFSFTNGNTIYWCLVGVFVIYFWIFPHLVRKWLLIAASCALFIAIPISISRTLFFQVILSLCFAGIFMMRKPKYIGKALLVILGLIVIMAVLSQMSFMQTSIDVFITRFTSANESEGGLEGTLINRFLGGMVEAIINSEHLSFWGYGIGLGTNMASILLTGERTFLIAEGEWARIIGEMGVFLGLVVLCVRVLLTVKMTRDSILKMRKGDPLAWMLLSAGAIIILQGQWAQPTALGFSSLFGGLILASLGYVENSKK